MTNDAADCDELMSEHATDIYSIEKIVRHRTLHIPTGSAAHPPPHPFLHLLSASLLSWPGPHPTGDQRSTSLQLLLFPTSLPCDWVSICPPTHTARTHRYIYVRTVIVGNCNCAGRARVHRQPHIPIIRASGQLPLWSSPHSDSGRYRTIPFPRFERFHILARMSISNKDHPPNHRQWTAATSANSILSYGGTCGYYNMYFTESFTHWIGTHQMTDWWVAAALSYDPSKPSNRGCNTPIQCCVLWGFDSDGGRPTEESLLGKLNQSTRHSWEGSLVM